MLGIEYIMSTNVLPVAICCCLQTNKYDQSLRVMDIYVLTKFHYFYVVSFELWVLNLKKKMNKTPYHSPIHLQYDATNPYIQSTTVLSDTKYYCT